MFVALAHLERIGFPASTANQKGKAMIRIAEIYQRFQSENDEVQDLATAEWDAVCLEHDSHMEEIRELLPQTVRILLKTVCLHDATISQASNVGRYFVIKLTNCVSWLSPSKIPSGFSCELVYAYFLDPVPVSVTKCEGKWGSKEWLYDSFEQISPGIFKHEILLGDGTAYSITFTEFDFSINPK